MLAPSENHLEDWIALDPDRAISIDDDKRWHIFANMEIVGQQIKLPTGKADIIFRSPSDTHSGIYTIIELKRGNINALTLAQTYRYMHDLQQVWAAWFLRLCKSGVTTNHFSKIDLPLINGIIIGHSITDQCLVDVCWYSRIRPFIYKFEGGHYSFQLLQTSYALTGIRPSLRNYPDLIQCFDDDYAMLFSEAVI